MPEKATFTTKENVKDAIDAGLELLGCRWPEVRTPSSQHLSRRKYSIYEHLPDKGGSDDAFRAVMSTKEVLGNSLQRAASDVFAS